MTFSIITPCFNSEKTIERTIKSVIGQKGIKLEYIIVDGVSTDFTSGIIRKYKKHIDKIISEPDEGIYDAMNKGIAAADGEIIGILNSDDYFYSADVLSDIQKKFESERLDCVFGNIVFFNENNPDKIIRTWQSSAYKQGSFRKGWHPPHPGVFIKKECYDKYGMFDKSLKVSADFELMLRFFELYKIRTAFLDKTVTSMSLGGESTGSLKNIIQGNRNCLKAFRKNNMPVSAFYLFHRLMPKIRQLFSRNKK